MLPTSDQPVPFEIDPDLVTLVEECEPTDLEALADLYQEPIDDKQIELYIFCCFQVFQKSGSIKYLSLGAEHAAGWEYITPAGHRDLDRRRKILSAVSLKAIMHLSSSESDNFETALQYSAAAAHLNPGISRDMDSYAENLFRGASLYPEISKANKARMLYFLAEHFIGMFTETGSVRYLDEAVADLNESLSIVRTDDPARMWIQRSLRDMLRRRSTQKRSMSDLDDVLYHTDVISKRASSILMRTSEIQLQNRLRQAQTILNGGASRVVFSPGASSHTVDIDCNSLPAKYRAKYFKSLREGRDNPVAWAKKNGPPIDVRQLATDVRGANRSAKENIDLARIVYPQFLSLGDFECLDVALELAGRASAESKDDETRAEALYLLANMLTTRFLENGSSDDMDKSVTSAEISLGLTPVTNSARHRRVLTVGRAISMRYKRRKMPADLDRLEEILQEVPITQSNDVLKLHAEYHNCRFEETKKLHELDQCIDLHAAMANLNVSDINVRLGREMSLAFSLLRRFEISHDLADLDRIIENLGGIDDDPSLHNEFCRRWNLHGMALFHRYKSTGIDEYLLRAIQSFRKGWTHPGVPVDIRLKAAHELSHILTFTDQPKEAYGILKEAIETLLPSLAPKSLKNSDKQRMLSYEAYLGLASNGATVALLAGEEPSEAVKLLEQGRALIAGSMLEMRIDISELEEKHPELAKDFLSLTEALDLHSQEGDTHSKGAFAFQDNTKRLQEAEERLQDVTNQIRSDPQFENFLLPPTAEQLMASASGGPVALINVNPARCDAFIVEEEHIRVVKLEKLELKTIQDNLVRLRMNDEEDMWEILEWLWDTVANPILDALGFKTTPASGVPWPQIWWIPTGPLSHFPLHAAGMHLEDTGNTVLDRVVSSYSLSIKGLIHIRQRKVRTPQVQENTSTTDPGTLQQSDRALLVSMPETVGHSSLYYADEEAEILKGLWLSVGLETIIPSRLETEEVLSALSTCNIFHFAGHGSFNPSDPSQSSLLLNDWQTCPLTVSKLWERRSQQNTPFLAYLSACSTGTSDGKYVEEGINLTNAYQLAGFRHVVGTLWEVNDETCVDVAERFYELVLRDGLEDSNVALALHEAVRALRNDSVESTSLRGGIDARNGKVISGKRSNLHWIPYVHFGV
ncbi:hypothetical protein TWF694_002573 [Orbilia ellipsospora]|uniref:CHAT domain-containing protein n=1 Tax=Orbilia ellipsospora TaxID=2528407 RepID=A0AAV9X4Y2_9PEZI